MNTNQWAAWLRSHEACTSGYAEAHTKTPSEWWGTTQRGDWMLWVLRKAGKTDKATYVQIAVFCAEINADLLGSEGLAAIAAAKAWLANPCEETRAYAYRAAADAYRAAAAAADAAADAYRAAAAAADAAADADAAAAYRAAAADADAAAAYRAAAAADAYRAAVRAKLADKIRELVPTLTIQEIAHAQAQ